MNFHNGFAEVMINGKWGFIDESGKEVVPLIYDYIESFENGFAEVMINDKWGFIDESGKEVVPLIYDYDYIELSRWHRTGND